MYTKLELADNEYILEIFNTVKFSRQTYFQIDNQKLDYCGNKYLAVQAINNMVTISFDHDVLRIAATSNFLLNKDLVDFFNKVKILTERFETNYKTFTVIVSFPEGSDLMMDGFICGLDNPAELMNDIESILTDKINLSDIKLVKSFYNVYTDNEPSMIPNDDSLYLVIDKDSKHNYKKLSSTELYDPNNRTEIDKEFKFMPDQEVAIKIRKIISYGFTEFIDKFKTKDDLVNDALKYMKEYIELGISMDKILIVINFLNEYKNTYKQDNKKNDKVRKNLKLVRSVLSSIETIKIVYVVRSDDYVHTKCPHERSGHWRHYSNGTKTWINSCRIHKDK